jgi:hypothetical protein
LPHCDVHASESDPTFQVRLHELYKTIANIIFRMVTCTPGRSVRASKREMVQLATANTASSLKPKSKHSIMEMAQIASVKFTMRKAGETSAEASCRKQAS